MLYIRKIILSTVLLVFFIPVTYAQEHITTSDTTLQQTQSDVEVIEPSSLTHLSDFNSIWEITKLGGGLRWVIILVLVVGMASILYKYAELIFDSKRARPIYELNIKASPLSKIEQVVINNPNNLIHQLYGNMLNIFRSTETAEDSHYEITNFSQIQQDRFATFQSKLAFLSDTAGALGLLGTVWGMFVTFFKGNLDNQVILHGMGIALITTLMGLVVSIILNFFSTQVQGFFRKKIDGILHKGDELRLRLLIIQQGNYNRKSEIDTSSFNLDELTAEDQLLMSAEKYFEETTLETEDTVDNQSEDNVNYELITVNGNEQTAQVNTRLKKPLTVQVKNTDGEGTANQTVTFFIEKGNGTFRNGSKVEEILSNDSGHAETQLILGNIVGENVVKVRLNNNGKFLKFNATGKAAPPAQLKYISGNLQNLPAGQEIKEPFVVQLLDSYNNPIPDHPVIFKIKLGKGYFPGNKNTHITNTDKNGFAKSYFILNSEPGFNSITAHAKGLRKLKIDFEVLGQ